MVETEKQLHVFRFGEYGVIAFDAEHAIEIISEHEGECVLENLIENGSEPVQLPDNSHESILFEDDLDADGEPRLIEKTCADWIADKPGLEVLWREPG